jgi:hypothetical protein
VNALPARLDASAGAGRRDARFWVLFAAVFTAAYISWRPFEILFTLSDALFCVALVLAVQTGRLPLAPFGPLSGPWYLCVLVLLAGLFLGSMVNGDPERWLVVALQYSFAYLLLPMLLVMPSIGQTRQLLLAFAMGVAAMQLFGAAVYFGYDGDYMELEATFGHAFVSGSRRLGAFLADANWNSAMCAMALPCVIYLLNRRVIAGWQALILLLSLGLGVLLAGSFSGFMSAVLALLVVGAASGMRRGLRLTMAGAAAAGLYLLAGGPLPQAFAKRVAPALERGNISEAGTFEGRWDLILEAWNMTDHTMLIGLGVDQYRVVSAHGAPVHNIYLLLWTEGGLLALLGWIGLLVLMGVITAVCARIDRLTAGLAAAGFLVFLIQTTANPHMYARMWIVPVLLMMGLAYRTGRGRTRLHQIPGQELTTP